MIEYLRGELTDVSPAYVMIEAYGVGYGMNISLNTYSAIQGRQEARLWVYEAIREDAYVLYGFATRKEREMFLLLITVPGVGANTARMILSEMTVAELCDVITTGNEKILKTVKGIGLRTAQRIIVDLRDKIATSGIADESVAGSGKADTHAVPNSVKEEAVGALTMLGFAPAPSAKVVVAILKEQPELSVEQVIKSALRQIK